LKNETFYSNAKLLITGEYVVLDGSWALATPLRVGQKMEVFEHAPTLLWKNFDRNGKLWFEAEFELSPDFKELFSSEKKISETLRLILKQTRKLNPAFLQNLGAEVHNHLSFEKEWGLGSSSTLINNLAQWAKIDPFDLQQNTFGGSGYDIACAAYDVPILFLKKNDKVEIIPIKINWPFKDELFFVYLNQKQNSRESISYYKQLPQADEKTLRQFSDLSTKFVLCATLDDFEKLIQKHEALMSKLLNLPPVKEKLFPDYPGSIKSLGAWGGDFVLVTRKDVQQYFPQKGFSIVFSFKDLVK
jgi:mevalonate kinase